MASKRILKKDVKYVTWELIAECLVFQVLHPEVKEETIIATLEKITEKHNEIMDRVNSTRGKQARPVLKETYRGVISGLNEMTVIVKDLYQK